MKLIIFDLDGVLVDAKEIHYNALNLALEEIGSNYTITRNEHLSIYDGLKTTRKLQLLHENKGLPIESFNDVYKKKQQITDDLLNNVNQDLELYYILLELKKKFKLACCSNSIRSTVFKTLKNLGILDLFDVVLSNEDVKNSKPHPEIYWKAMSELNILPSDTLIVEDSPVGLAAANSSGSTVLRVHNRKDINLNKILSMTKQSLLPKTAKWQDFDMNVVIPMAGEGSRFKEAGYTFPKPLIEIDNKPMIQLVVENLNVNANFIFLVRKEHVEKYNLPSLLKLICKNFTIIEVESLTQGAACTVLLAKKYIDNDKPLLISNSDQFVEWDSNEFFYKASSSDIDASIVTFTASHPKWSFAKTNSEGFVTEVAEKNPISNIATCGLYYWKKGSDFVKYAEQMISKNIRVNNEFYVCPVFNEAILDHKKITTFNISKMWGLGTPEDLNVFLNNFDFLK